MKKLNQPLDKTNKPCFLINVKNRGTLTSNRLYNHLLKVFFNQYDLEDTKGNQDNVFLVPREELKLACGGKNNAQIKENLDLLMNSKIEIVEHYNKKDYDGKQDKTIMKSNFLAAYKEEWFGDYIEFEIPNLLIRYLRQLNSENRLLYTQLEDTHLIGLKKKHSLVLYEILKDMEFKKNFEMFFGEIKEHLGLETKYRNVDLRRKILLPAFQEILETTKLNFTYEFEQQMNKKLMKREQCLIINFLPSGKSIREEKDLLTYADFVRTFRAFCIGNNKSFGVKDKGKFSINENGFIVDLQTQKSIHPEEAKFIWEKLYNKNYLGNTEKFYTIMNTTKEEFEEIEYITREQHNLTKFMGDF